MIWKGISISTVQEWKTSSLNGLLEDTLNFAYSKLFENYLAKGGIPVM
ncbi:MAG: hypothetical protein GX462_03245 [Thermotogaceae bacterium]|nr:hypothetical protein [Thermotogaceae bacterium]